MAGLVPGQDPGDGVQLGLVVREVRERDAGQQVIDPLLQHSPDRPDAARRVRTTSLRVDRVEIAVDFEGDVLRGLDHVLHADGVWLAREVIPALGAADRVYEARPPEPQQDLLGVVARRDRPTRALARALREVHRYNQAVLGPGGDAHGGNMRARVLGFNGRAEEDGRDALYRPLPPIAGLTLTPTCTPNTFSPPFRWSHRTRVFTFHITRPPYTSTPMPPSAPWARPRSGPCEYTPASSRPTSPYSRPQPGRQDAS